MPAKFTRLELVIIVASLVVLLFSNQPPEPGNADVRRNIEPPADVRGQGPLSQVQLDSPRGGEVSADSSEARQPAAITPDNPKMESVPRPEPQSKRIGMVDARKCDSLKYPNLMYGEITVRWVWNGTKFEPQKVCEVRESNGIVTIWSFDDRHKGVVISELPPDQVPTY